MNDVLTSIPYNQVCCRKRCSPLKSLNPWKNISCWEYSYLTAVTPVFRLTLSTDCRDCQLFCLCNPSWGSEGEGLLFHLFCSSYSPLFSISLQTSNNLVLSEVRVSEIGQIQCFSVQPSSFFRLFFFTFCRSHLVISIGNLWFKGDYNLNIML